MLTDFNNIWWECTRVNLQQTGVAYFFHYTVKHMHEYYAQ